MRTKTQTIPIVLASISLAGSAINLRAQPAPVQQFDQNQLDRQQQQSLLNNLTTTNAPELYPGENQDVGPQRLLKIKPTQTYFEGLADTQFAYTDNNRLAHNQTTATAYTINTVQFALAPLPYDLGAGKFAPRAGFRSQWYNYDIGAGSSGTESRLDFDAQTVFVSGQYLWRQKWEIDGELDYTRLLNQSHYSQFYYEVAPIVGLQRLFLLRPNMLLSLGLQEEYHTTGVPSVFGSRTDVNDRLDSTLSVTITYQIVPNLVLQPYYRFEHTYYPDTAFNTDRNDFLHTVGAVVSYNFTPQFSARIYTVESFRTSDDPNTTSYKKLDTGIGASVVCRF